MKVLEAGGNAIDAAVAVFYMTTVVEQHQAGLGGDGFILAYIAKEDRVIFINGTGPAPARATREFYGKLGEIPDAGPYSTDVPGAVGASTWRFRATARCLTTSFSRRPSRQPRDIAGLLGLALPRNVGREDFSVPDGLDRSGDGHLSWRRQPGEERLRSRTVVLHSCEIGRIPCVSKQLTERREGVAAGTELYVVAAHLDRVLVAHGMRETQKLFREVKRRIPARCVSNRAPGRQALRATGTRRSCSACPETREDPGLHLQALPTCRAAGEPAGCS